MTRVYSNLIGDVVYIDNTKMIFLFDERTNNGNLYCPNIVLSNKLAVELLRDYLNKIINEWDEKK